MSRQLVVAAHGTASAEGRDVVEACAAAAAAALAVPYVVGYVDVCGPTLEDVLAEAERPVVVPLFLASGYHVRHDVPAAVASAPGAVVTPALGAEPEVVQALAERVSAAHGAHTLQLSGAPGPRRAAAPDPGPDAVVLTAAGSSVRRARAEVVAVAELLADRLGVPTGTAYLTGPGPRPEEEVARLRAEGHGRVVLASHLLAPGHFLDRARSTAATLGTVASDALGAHPALVSLVARRYREAAR